MYIQYRSLCTELTPRSSLLGQDSESDLCGFNGVWRSVQIGSDGHGPRGEIEEAWWALDRNYTREREREREKAVKCVDLHQNGAGFRYDCSLCVCVCVCACVVQHKFHWYRVFFTNRLLNEISLTLSLSLFLPPSAQPS